MMIVNSAETITERTIARRSLTLMLLSLSGSRNHRGIPTKVLQVDPDLTCSSQSTDRMTAIRSTARLVLTMIHRLLLRAQTEARTVDRAYTYRAVTGCTPAGGHQTSYSTVRSVASRDQSHDLQSQSFRCRLLCLDNSQLRMRLYFIQVSSAFRFQLPVPKRNLLGYRPYVFIKANPDCAICFTSSTGKCLIHDFSPSLSARDLAQRRAIAIQLSKFSRAEPI